MGKTGIFGKHPSFGDFIGAGMSKPMQVALEEWMGAVLPRVRDNLGDVWQPFYDIALPLRFWLGEGVVPAAVGGPVAGVMVFSHDKVGRRFPLIALVEGAQMPPPTLVPEQRWYEALQTLMLEHDTPQTAAELAEMLNLPTAALPDPFEGGEAGFWAVHHAGAVEAMMANVAATDHRRAVARRSYWWSAGDPSRTATFHATEGWPDAAVFQWLLAGNAADEPAPEPEPTPAPIPEEVAALEDVPEPDEVFDSAVAEAQGEFEGEPSIVPTSDPWWSGEGARPVPKALYEPVIEETEEDGPQSPFSDGGNRVDVIEAEHAEEAKDALADEAEKD
ncbi:type VI secretion system-associated protein TagF [Litoreibacter janthinus]|uniref:Type VI secretion-associated protein, BMA_A0400 family n=1 Tax=Litoreibacter janthinus TaxID=670154 RepID=A0A1I6IDP8_9RHOB|nr:type VI secretion system-associated protein TagF [Litoreibacter janthinus]SFR64895.1 type VI secretion-associated protein, BMA_A0400 family [Litoreibacter janthinus]